MTETLRSALEDVTATEAAVWQGRTCYADEPQLGASQVVEVPFTVGTVTPPPAEIQPPAEQRGLGRRLGNWLFRTFGYQQEVGRKEKAASRIGRLTARIETKAAQEEQKLIEEQEAGDKAILRQYMKYADRQYDLAVKDQERFERRANASTVRAGKYEQRGDLYGRLMGWLNRGLAMYFGWRARSAASRCDYYLGDDSEA